MNTPEPAPGNYYVSVVDAGRVGLLLGPFVQHAEALARVDDCRRHAERIDLWSHFYAFGTVRLGSEFVKPGLFNEALRVK